MLRLFPTLLAYAAAVTMLLLPALYNRFPLFYPDSVAYLHYGDRLVRLLVPITDRPVYYGVAIWPLHLEISLWPVVVAQALIVAHVVRVTLRCLGVATSPAGFTAFIAALTLLTPVSWYTSQIMPDIFASIIVLICFLLGFCLDRLSRAERIWLFSLAVLSAMFHPSHLALAAGLALLAVAARLLGRLLGLLPVQPLRIAAPPVLALVLSLTGSIVIFGQARLVPDGPPYFLGRLIASGPALNYLRDACARGERYELCPDLDNFPRETWQVLWLPSSPLRTHAGFRAEVMAEADAIVRGTILAYPMQVLRNALYATRRQFVTIASELVTGPDTGQIAAWNPYAEPGFRDSRQADGLAASGQMAPFNQMHRVVYLFATGLMLLAIIPLWRQGLRPLAVLIAVTVAALAGNAFLTGVISDITGRYQGRIAWLPTLLTISAFVLLWRMRETMRRPRR